MVMILAVVTGYGWVQKGRLDRLEALRLEEKVGALEADRKALSDQIRGLEGKVAKATAEAAKATAELARVRTTLSQVNQQLVATRADRAAVKAASDALAGRPLKELQDAYERMGYHPRPALRPR